MIYENRHIDEKFIEEYANSKQFNEAAKLINLLEEKPTVDRLNIFSKLIKEMSESKLYSQDFIVFLEEKNDFFKKQLDRSVGEELGRFIKEERAKQGLSLVQLEELSGVSGSYINRLEKGERNAPSLLIVDKIAQGLGVPFVVLAKKAGINIDCEKTDNYISNNDLKSISKVIQESRVSLRNMGPEMHDDDKENLIDIIDLIANADWENNANENFILMDKLIKKLHKID